MLREDAMAAGTKRVMRLEIALAVALEIGKLRLEMAEAVAERRAAMEFNQGLWRCVRRLAAKLPDPTERACISDAADAVEAAWGDPAAVTARNLDLARSLAGRSPTDGALRRLLEDWGRYRCSAPDAEFASWLVGCLDAEGGTQPAAA